MLTPLSENYQNVFYEQEFERSASPSASSSLYQAALANKNANYETSYGEYTEAEEVADELRIGGSCVEEGESSGGSWVDDLRRIVNEEIARSDTDDDDDDLPCIPGSYPNSPATPDRKASYLEVRSRKTNLFDNQDSNNVDGLGLRLFSEENENMDQVTSMRYSVPPPSIRCQTDPADEALRALHAIAVVNSALWSGVHNDDQISRTCSTVSTRGDQTFLAITTDVRADASLVGHTALTSATTEDFNEYVPYLRYVDSSIAESKRITPETSVHSFRAEHVNPSTFHSNEAPSEETHESHEQRQQGASAIKRRSRSLLKFVSRRPFSSSGSGLLSQRPSPSSTSPSPETSFSFGSNAASRISAAFMSKDVNRISATMSAGHRGKTEVTASSTRPRSCSSPPANEQTLSQRIESLDSPRPVAKAFSRRPGLSSGKSRTWSFTRAHSPSRRRSRSLSPAPVKGSPRDVLFRLRSARNWFWYALSSVTPRSSSDASARAKKGSGAASKWISPSPCVVVGV